MKIKVAMDCVEIIESARGNPQVLYQGFKYCLKRTNKNFTKNWRCVNSNSKLECSGRITTNNENKVIRTSQHNCLVIPNVAYTDVEKCKSICRKRARQEMTCIPKVYEEEFHQIKDSGLEFVTKMPAYESIKSSLYRHRNKALGVPALPKTRAEFIVPDYINKTEDGENFTIFDQGTTDRIIGFGSKLGIQGLSSKNTIFGDGTFKCCNSLFDQLYTFHVDLKSTEETTSVRPALYALLPNRKKDTYIKLLTLMKEHIPNFNPRSMKIDFETSTILACREMFPDCKLKGCNFHFNQSIWRKVQELGLAKRYREDKDIRKHIKLTAALAHLPPQYIDDGWLYIMESSPNFREIMDFNDYFVTQWLENSIVQDMWICYEERHRTTNVCESWHSRLNRHIGKSKPNLMELIISLKNDSRHYDIIQQRIDHNISPKKRAAKYIQMDRRINGIVSQIQESQDVEQALPKLASLINF